MIIKVKQTRIMQLRHRDIETSLNYKISEEDSDLIMDFIEINKRIPSTYQLEGNFILDEFLDLLKKEYPDNHLIFWKSEFSEYKITGIKIIVKNNNKKVQTVILRTGRTMYHDCDMYKLSGDNKYVEPEGLLVFSNVDIFYSIEHGLPSQLINHLNKILLVEADEKNKIHLICESAEEGFHTKQLNPKKIDLDFDLDLHYGKDFTKFHLKVINRINNGSKGIILFYGPPGTGKTYCIKRIINDLNDPTKKVLYLPNNMVPHLGTPAFNNFLIEFVDNDDSESKNSVLILIEDGERVLLKRENNPYGSDGVSNILNTTDGVLNDFLNVQILATFNTSLDKIDSAILRKRRALAIKEFEKLSVEDSQKLIDHLNIDYKAKEPMALADIYALEDLEDDAYLFKDSKSTNIRMGYR